MITLPLAILWPLPVFAVAAGPVTTTADHVLQAMFIQPQAGINAAPAAVPEFCNLSLPQHPQTGDALSPCRQWLSRALAAGTAAQQRPSDGRAE